MQQRLTLFVLLSLVLFNACSQPQQPQQIRIGYLAVTSNLPLFVALEKKMFEQQGLQVELKKFESSNLLGQALVSGAIDIDAGTSSFVGLGLAQTSAEKMKIFLSIVASEKNFMSSLLVKPDITAIEQLKNKTVGCFPGAAIKTFTMMFLKKNNAWGDQSRLVELPPPLQLQALENGSVDAVMCVEPTGTLARVTGKAKVFMHGPIERDIFPQWTGGYYSFNTDFIKNNPDMARKIYDIFAKSLQEIRNDMQAAKKTLTRFTPIQDEKIAQAVSIPEFTMGNTLDTQGFSTVADTLAKYGIIPKSPSLQWYR
ncbi:MAG: ABC transporter substrate-binding protein [Ignavibacteria bacterium]|nr:ABC transporter substrate-binding protein [Ignavibacteria bacterium]